MIDGQFWKLETTNKPNELQLSLGNYEWNIILFDYSSANQNVTATVELLTLMTRDSTTPGVPKSNTGISVRWRPKSLEADAETMSSASARPSKQLILLQSNSGV